MTILYQKKTYVPEQGVWVSTVAHDMDIGMDRCSETMVFEGNEEKVTNFSELDFQHLGYMTDEDSLNAAHEKMIRKWKEKLK